MKPGKLTPKTGHIMREYSPELADEICAYIYGLACPRSGVVRYVGKAISPKARMKDHLRETRRQTPVYDWIASLRKNGETPDLVILAKSELGDWESLEKKFIAEYRQRGTILNVADGGNEPFCSKAVRAANGRANALKIHTNPHAKRFWKLKHALGFALRGGYVRESTKEKMRDAAKRHPSTLGDWAAI